jgi:DNA helicase HerA-like ATPase
MRANPAFDTEAAIQALGTGEALISFLDAKGSPSVVERAMVIAPCSRMGPVTDDERNGLINHSPVYGKYEDEVDRESAFEMLQKQATTESQDAPAAKGLSPWMTVFSVGSKTSCSAAPGRAAASATA